jgi:hypothetical protein
VFCADSSDEQSALKVLYLVIRTPIKNRPNVTGRPRLDDGTERREHVLRRQITIN